MLINIIITMLITIIITMLITNIIIMLITNIITILIIITITITDLTLLQLQCTLTHRPLVLCSNHQLSVLLTSTAFHLALEKYPR